MVFPPTWVTAPYGGGGGGACGACGAILSRIFIVLVFPGAGALVLFSLARLPPQAVDPVPLRTDRPLDVGDALGEAFLRQIERPAPVALSGLIRVQDESFSAA
jgi:hypothetical protein